MLVAMKDKQRVQACDAVAGFDYLCPDTSCRGPLRLRQRKGYVKHFYHLGEVHCLSERESRDHEVAKIALQDLYRNRKIEAELEVYWSDVAKLIDSEGFQAISQKLKAKDRRCDILLNRFAKDSKTSIFAIEIQGANLALSEFHNRIHDWNLIDVPVVWVALMKPTWQKNLVHAESGYTIEKTTLRDFERQLLRRYGYIWYFDPSERFFIKGTVKPHQLYKNPTDYFDQNAGEMISDEGGYYPSARWVDLNLAGPISIDTIGLKKISRTSKNGVESKIYDWCELNGEQSGDHGHE